MNAEIDSVQLFELRKKMNTYLIQYEGGVMILALCTFFLSKFPLRGWGWAVLFLSKGNDSANR